MLGADGSVYQFGSAGRCGSPATPAGRKAVDIVRTPDGLGYWTLTGRSPNGTSSGQGAVDFFACPEMPTADKGSYEKSNTFSGQLRAGEVPVSLSAVPDGSGYWVFTNLGRVFPFGKAHWYGDMGNVRLNEPVVGSATASRHGYLMVASDGGIFTFGDARFHGSMGGTHLNAPVVGMAATLDSRGYWLVAADGGIFTFGDARFFGSMGGTHLNQAIVDMVVGPTGRGYLMVASDGGVFTFGDVPFHGSLGSHPPLSPITSITTASSTAHSILASSVKNFSAALERPYWTLSCDIHTEVWAFAINNVRVIDSHGRPWLDFANGRSGPWHVTLFSGPPGGGRVTFTPVFVLKKNSTNGLYAAKASGRDPRIGTWCITGNSATVAGFSGSEPSLLLDGTFG